MLVCIATLIALGFTPPASAERPAELCVPAPGEVVALTAEGLLAVPPIDGLASPGDEAPTALACTDAMLVVAFPSARGSRLRFFAREGGRWSRRPGLERTLRFLPSRLSIVGETVIGVRERRGGFELHALPLGPEGRAEVRPLPAAPAALLAGPEEGQLLVAAGENLRSFLLPQVYSREVIPFDEPLLATARAEGSSLLAISTGRRVFKVDLSHRRSKGRLPVRAETTLPAAATRLLWPEEQGAIAAVLPDAEQVAFLSPVSLTPVRAIDLKAKPLAAGYYDGQVVLALAEGGIERVDFPELAVVTSVPPPAGRQKSAPARVAAREKDAATGESVPAALPAPQPVPLPSAIEPAPSASALPAEPPAPGSEPPAPEPAPPPAGAEPAPAAPASPESEPSAPEPAPLPAGTERRPPASGPKPPAPAPGLAPPERESAPAPTSSEPAPPAPVPVPVRSLPEPQPPASEAIPQSTDAEPNPPGSEKIPAAPAPESVPSSPGRSPTEVGSDPGATPTASGAGPAGAAPPRTPAVTRPVSPPAKGGAAAAGPSAVPPAAPDSGGGSIAPEPAPSSPPSSEGELRAAPEPPLPAGPGVLTGRITGRGELVAEIVILGPDNLLAERARISPVRRGGGLFFVLEGLAPGTYRIQPMGRDGTSLRSQPSFAAVQIGESTGAEVSFTITGSW